MRTLMRAGFLVTSLALVAAGCGGGSSNKTTGASGTASGEPVSGAQKGGSLTVLSLADVDSLDPGYWYYQYDYMALAQPTQRTGAAEPAGDEKAVRNLTRKMREAGMLGEGGDKEILEGLLGPK